MTTAFPGFSAERDSVTGGFVVRHRSTPGICHIVMPDGSCQCQQHHDWGWCVHTAAVRDQLQQVPDGSLRIIEGGKA